MQLFFEVLPVFLFFIAFKFYDIYVATVVGIVATLIQVIVTYVMTKSWDKKQLITLGIFSVFGGMTIYFHNPIFVKWKPTIVFWVFSLAILLSQVFTKKPIMQRLMEASLEEKATIPKKVWSNLNIAWAVFFIVLGAVNLYVAYHFDNNMWVNFKFYGITGALFVFSIFQAVYLVRYMTDQKSSR